MYSEAWVERLYRGFRRHLALPFDFVCFTDRPRQFAESIDQARITDDPPTYASCIEPYRLGVPMILVGLDTIIVGSIDHLARYCLEGEAIALPRAVYRKGVCNGVALVPAGNEAVYQRHNGENDMAWMERQPHVVIDDIWPGQVVSYKGHVKRRGLGDARIVFFHGREKPHELAEPWIEEHWR